MKKRQEIKITLTSIGSIASFVIGLGMLLFVQIINVQPDPTSLSFMFLDIGISVMFVLGIFLVFYALYLALE